MKRFTELMHDVSGAIMLTGQTLFSAFFVIVILVLVLFVEIQRVAHGILLFEQSENLAYLGAFVLVMMLLTLEFVTHYVETKNDYHEELQTDFSLRLLWQRLVYVSGFSGDWQPRHKSPAQRIKSYSHLLTATILALAVAGSMSSAISGVDGNWITGLQAIATQSTLAELVEWLGGLLFALALVVGAQRLTSYVAQRASETLLDTQQDNSEGVHLLEIPKTLGNGNHVDESINIVQDDDTEPQGLVAVCTECGWQSTPKDSILNVRKSLLMHQRRCAKCQEKAVQA